jgi:hypothetical protein
MTIQEDMDKKYECNYPIVKCIAELFGLRLLSFNPGWRFEPIYDEVYLGQYSQGYSVPNDFIGKLALILGYDWEFECDDEEVGKEVKKSETRVRDLRLRSDEADEFYEHMSSVIKDIPESDEKKLSIKASMESIQEYNKSSINDAEKYLARKKKVLEIRNKLRNGTALKK